MLEGGMQFLACCTYLAGFLGRVHQQGTWLLLFICVSCVICHSCESFCGLSAAPSGYSGELGLVQA